MEYGERDCFLLYRAYARKCNVCTTCNTLFVTHSPEYNSKWERKMCTHPDCSTFIDWAISMCDDFPHFICLTCFETVEDIKEDKDQYMSLVEQESSLRITVTKKLAAGRNAKNARKLDSL